MGRVGVLCRQVHPGQLPRLGGPEEAGTTQILTTTGLDDADAAALAWVLASAPLGGAW